MKKSKSPHHHSVDDSHHHAANHHNHISMDGVKIKRVKRNKKHITTTEKIVAGIGVGSSLMGMGGAVKPAPPTTQFVRTNTTASTSAGSKVKAALGKIFGSTFGAKTAKADDVSDLQARNQLRVIIVGQTSRLYRTS